MEGKKFDEGKPRMDLLPGSSLEEISKVLAFGAKKYGEWNWARGMDWSRLTGAALRHIFAWVRGENVDPETGLSHLAHAACCLLFLMHFQYSKTGDDDRWPQIMANTKNEAAPRSEGFSRPLIRQQIMVPAGESRAICIKCATGEPHTHD